MRFFAFLVCASLTSASSLVRREAEAAADPEPVADPEAEPVYGLNVNGGGNGRRSQIYHKQVGYRSRFSLNLD